MSYVFSKEAAEKQYLRLFLESVATSGVDLVIVGDSRPPYQLPSNVRHYEISWDEFVSLAEERLEIDGQALRSAERYKIIDFKPLFGFLFPNLVRSYDWWGHVDNDMLLGDIYSGVSPFLDSTDIISGIADHPTWGPFTLFRNTDRINTIFRNATASLQQMFGSRDPVCFDEWGQCGALQRNKGASMSGILEHPSAKTIRVQRGVSSEIVWDGVCKFKTYAKPKYRCAECAYTRTPQGSAPLVGRNTDGTYHEAFLCHYEYAKHRIEDMLNTTGNLDSLVEAGEFRVNFLQGFQSSYENDKAKILAVTRPTQPPRLRQQDIVPALPMEETGSNPVRATSVSRISPREPPASDKILLVSFIFSEEAMAKKYVRFFAETASSSGANILLIGDVPPPFALPTKVRHHSISWDGMMKLAAEKLNLNVAEMKNATMYKVNDFKPLFAYIFPELVEGFDWWGHCDNDLILGDVASVVARYQSTSDIISGSPDHSTWGPFTLFRNTPAINALFKRATISLDKIFANPRPLCFDEWGSCGYKRWPGASMAGIVDSNAEALGLRVQRGVGVEAVWDGFCHYPKYGFSKKVRAHYVYVSQVLKPFHSTAPNARTNETLNTSCKF